MPSIFRTPFVRPMHVPGDIHSLPITAKRITTIDASTANPMPQETLYGSTIRTAVPPGSSRKFHSPWDGPHRVIERLSDCTYCIQDTLSTKGPRVVHFNRLKPYISDNRPLSATTSDDTPPPPPAGTHLEICEEQDNRHSAAAPSAEEDGTLPPMNIPQPQCRYPQ